MKSLQNQKQVAWRKELWTSPMAWLEQLVLLGQWIIFGRTEWGGMRDESRKKSNPNGRRTQKSAHKRAEREPKSPPRRSMDRFIVYPLIGAAELWCQLSCQLSSLSRHQSRIESVTSSVKGVCDSNWARDTSFQEGRFLFALCNSSLEAGFFGSSWPLRLSEPRFLLTALMFLHHWSGSFSAVSAFLHNFFSVYLFQLLFPTTVFIWGGHHSNNRQSTNYFSVVVNNRQTGL